MGKARTGAGRALRTAAICLGVAAAAAGAALAAGAVDVERTVVLEADAPRAAPAEPPDPADVADAMLSDEARAARASYGTAQTGLVETLRANIWTCGRSGVTLSFDGRTFTVNDNGTAYTTAYVVTAASAADSSGSGGKVSQWVRRFTVQTTRGTYMGSLVTRTDNATGDSVTNLECDAFADGIARWTLARRSSSLQVVGPDETWFASNGTSSAELARALNEFVTGGYPTVTTATWNNTMDYDYQSRTAVLPFWLDDAQQTKLKATLDLSTGTFSVRRASW